jgi:DNA-binding CsgD family transcriptional regulator
VLGREDRPFAVGRPPAGRGSNPAIAAQLLVSRRTVQTYVSHILGRLGARSRVGIARQADQRGRNCST